LAVADPPPGHLRGAGSVTLTDGAPAADVAAAYRDLIEDAASGQPSAVQIVAASASTI
jgi:hypothetical protein